MRWKEPSLDVGNRIVKIYTIRPGSILDVPRAILVNVRDFENKLREHFLKQEDEQKLLLAMLPIYKLYKKEGVIELTSTQMKSIRHRHEYVVLGMVKSNVAHLEHLVNYFP